MAKKYVQGTLDVHVKGHKRSDPRINKKVDVKPYKREQTQKAKPFIKTTDPVKELYGKISEEEKRVIKMKSLTIEAQKLLDELEKGEIGENSTRLKNVLKNVSPQDRKIIIEEIAKRKIIDAFKELIIEKGMKNPEMLKELLLIDENGLKFFDSADQIRIKLLQDFYKGELKSKSNYIKSEKEYYDHIDFERARASVFQLRDFIKQDTKDRDRAIEIGESKERIKYLDEKLGEKHILLLKAIEKRNRINKLPRGSIARAIEKPRKRFDELPEDMTKEDLKEYKRLYGLETLSFITSEEGFEENNQGKHAIWRGKETQAFIEWKKSFKGVPEVLKKHIELKKAELKASNKPPQDKYLYGGIQAKIDKQVEEMRLKLKKAKEEGKVYFGNDKNWEIVRVNQKTITLKDRSGYTMKNQIQFITEDQIRSLKK